MSIDYNPVGWFEIPVIDMPRAKAFYEHLFAVKLEEHEIGSALMAWFPMKENAIGSTGSLIKGEGYEPSSIGVLVYFTAPDIEGVLERTREKGGQVLREKSGIGEYGFIAIILDSEGNRIGLHARE
ncbi:VOC family protein [candidate division KSB1 bacterium]